MKILYLTIRFLEDSSDVHTDLVEALINQGHSVDVVSCNSLVANDTLVEKSMGLRLLKIKTGNQFEQSKIKKGVNMVLLQQKMKRGIKKFLHEETYDLILYSTPPITFLKVVEYCKKKYKCKTYLALKDIFPQNAVDLEMFAKKSLIFKYFESQERKLYKVSDKIGCMSKANKDYILRMNPEIKEEKVELFPNAGFKKSIENRNKPKEKIDFIFGGNIGVPQAINELIKVFSNNDVKDKVRLIIIGEGSESANVDKMIRESEFENIRFLPKVTSKEYTEILKKTDVGIISLDKRFTIPNFPSKLIGYMAEAIPVLALVDRATDIPDIITEAGCGWYSYYDDIEDCVKTITQIVNERNLIARKGTAGNQYYNENYDVYDCVEKLVKFIEEEDNEYI